MDVDIPAGDRVVSVWLGRSALEGQSTMPFLRLPDSVINLPKFSLLENSGNELFRSQLAAFELMFT